MTTTIVQPYLSVDTVAIRLVPQGLEVLLAQRWNEPFAGMNALPGVLLLPGETINDAAQRALADKTDIMEDIRGFMQFGVFDDTNRDPRGATISVATFVFPDPNAPTSGSWINVVEVGELPFDHNVILTQAMSLLTNPSAELARGILGATFTSGDYALLVESAGGAVDRTNLSRIIEARLPVSKDGSAVSKFSRRRGVQWKF